MSSDLPRVAKVVDDSTIVINRGNKDGIRKGQKFLIFGIDVQVTDPITKEPLGTLELVRGEGIVAHVQERISTLKTATLEKLPAKRVIKKMQPFYTTMFGHDRVEEILPEQLIEKPFENPEVGDYAKPI